ncbi:MAG TPA: hypothetical protein VEQ63_05575 [Bryobacteraceae bacterium]|nr:hypothetical protein [Bryobacteraceae bacterium]
MIGSKLSRRRLLALGGAAGLSVACTRKRSSGFQGNAYVANENASTLAVVDLSSFTVIKQIQLDSAATEVISHPQRSSVYALAPTAGVIYEIDTEKIAIRNKTLVARSAAATMRLGPDDRSIWCLNPQDQRLVRLDLERNAIDTRIDIGPEASSFELARCFEAGGHVDRAAVAYSGRGCFRLIDMRRAKALPEVQVSERIGSIRFLSDGKSLMIANTAKRALTAVEATEGRIITNLQLAVSPDNLCFNQDGGQLFVTGEGSHALVVVYPYYLPQVAETVLAGHAPGAMAASDNLLFIANPLAGEVSILNIVRRKVVAVASVGAEPAHITITPDDQYALVLNRKSGDMAVIRTAAVVPDRRKTAALFTMIPVGSRPVSAVVKAFA